MFSNVLNYFVHFPCSEGIELFSNTLFVLVHYRYIYIYIYIYEKMIDKTRHNVMVNMPYRVVKQPRNALKAIWKRKRV